MISRQTGVAIAKVFAVALGLAVSAGAQAADLQSVDAVLARLAKSNAIEVHERDSAAALLKDVVAFRSRSAELSASDAATQWLALWDRAVAIEAMEDESGYDAIDAVTRQPVGLGSMLAALPSPEAWPAIRTQSDARAAKAPDDARALGLRLLAEVLVRDTSAARTTLVAFERMAAPDEAEEQASRQAAVQEVQEKIDALYGSREQIAEAFRTSINTASKESYGIGVQVPDLVGLVGEAKAEEILVEALNRPVDLYVNEGEATKALARKLALREIVNLRQPQWGLVDAVGTSALYEALQARFDQREGNADAAPAAAATRPEEFWRDRADFYYFLDLVTAGRHAEAERVMLRSGGQSAWGALGYQQAMDELVRRGQSAAVHAYLADLLRRQPQLYAWDFFLEQAAAIGRSKEAIALLNAVLKRSDLSAPWRAALTQKRVDALLAADQVDAAVAGFRVMLATPPSADDKGLRERVAAAIRLAALGRVLNKPEWSRLGLEYARQAVALRSGPEGYWRTSALPALMVELRRQGRADMAQVLALAEVERDRVINGSAKRAALVELMGIYDAAGRFGDVRRMLNEVPSWGARDLGDLAVAKDSMGTPIGLMAARALKANGDTAGAAAAARAVAMGLPNYDPGYQLWIELAGESAIAELDRLAAADPFEERPLVWKAVALNAAGQPAAAEESVRRAIAIDPSDGEQGANDRMRAYAVLADVLEAKGDAKSAQGYRRAVAAIRMSEQADELYKLGLYQRAFAGYRAALAEFSDAYCIQSRLAVQLSKRGFREEALKHYRRAFELMPDSFGRVESHCFGCESVFAGPTEQSVAEEVFSGLLKGDTTKPQLAYMLGYLRKVQGRYDEAVVLFRRAIALDAQYLNAWRQLNELGNKTYIDPSERDIARLRLYELDPRQRHVRYQLDTVADLPGLWRATARFDAARSAWEIKAGPVYPLAASIRAQQGRREPYAMTQDEAGQLGSDGRPLFTFTMADHRLLNATVRLMEVGKP